MNFLKISEFLLSYITLYFQKLTGWNILQGKYNQSCTLIIIDAGSTGSRVHFFQWQYDKDNYEWKNVKLILPHVSHKVKGGIANYINDLVDDIFVSDTTMKHPLKNIFSTKNYYDLIEYMHSIKRIIDDVIPLNKRRKTPVWFFGTAGVRQLQKRQQIFLIDFIKEVMSGWNYVILQDSIQILHGSYEGLYSWFFLNQLLKSSSNSESLLLFEKNDINSYAEVRGDYESNSEFSSLIEIGGASAQIITDVMGDNSVETLSSAICNNTRKSHISVESIDINRGILKLNLRRNECHIVYSKSYHGLGRQLALQLFLREIIKYENYCIEHDTAECKVYESPCFPADVALPGNFRSNISVSKNHAGIHISELPYYTEKKKWQKYIKGKPNSSYYECQQLLKLILFNKETSVLDVSDRNSIEVHFDLYQDIIATENIYYFYKLILHNKKVNHFTFTINDLERRAVHLCSLQSLNEIRLSIHPDAELEKAKTACFGLTYIISFLKQMLHIDPNRVIKTIKQVKNTDIEWPGGFILLELPSIINENSSIFKYIIS